MLRFLSIGFVVWLLALAPKPALAQTPQEIVNKVSASISADASPAEKSKAISLYFTNPVEIIINDSENEYNLGQAPFVLEEFFKAYPVRTFTLSHQGNSGETWYAMGLYFSTHGDFDTNIFLKKSGSTYQIYQIRFEQDN